MTSNASSPQVPSPPFRPHPTSFSRPFPTQKDQVLSVDFDKVALVGTLKLFPTEQLKPSFLDCLTTGFAYAFGASLGMISGFVVISVIKRIFQSEFGPEAPTGEAAPRIFQSRFGPEAPTDGAIPGIALQTISSRFFGPIS